MFLGKGDLNLCSREYLIYSGPFVFQNMKLLVRSAFDHVTAHLGRDQKTLHGVSCLFELIRSLIVDQL